jgi:hypothetical protein
VVSGTELKVVRIRGHDDRTQCEHNEAESFTMRRPASVAETSASVMADRKEG